MTITAAGSSLSKTYTYDARGNLATTTYPAGFTIRDVYDDNGIVTQTRYEQGGTVKTLFAATAMNSRGVYTSYSTGNGKTKEVTWDYTKETATRYYTAGVQDLNLTYESHTMNLLSRRDGIRSLTETFTYDINDRLTSARVNGVQQFAITYDAGAQGKILQKSDVGNYNYDPNKIHQLQYLTAVDGGADPNTAIGPNVHNITYTPFLKTETITENGYQLTYAYGSDQQRLTATLTHNGSTIEQKSYWGNMEGLTKNGNTYEIYYIAAGNGLNNIIVKQNGVINIYYAYTDQLGSINTLTDEAGNIVAEQNFDAWGRKRNPNDWTYNNVPNVPDWLYRGFTGHEHVAVFALVNMNGRMYDPMTGQMLAPDNYIPNPYSPWGYNRYNYANANPLKYIDPDGEFIFSALLPGIGTFIDAALWGAVIGGAGYTASVAMSPGGFSNWNWGQFGKAVGFGAISGVATAGIGKAFGAVGMSGFGWEAGRAAIHGMSNGIISAASGGDFMQGFLSGSLSSLAGSAFMMYGGKFAASTAGTYAFSAVAGGVGAELSGGNFWEGAATGIMLAGLNHLKSVTDQAGAKYFANRKAAYKYMWDNSFDENGVPIKEVAAWHVENGTIVLPTDKNTLTSSDMNALPVSKDTKGNLFVKYKNAYNKIVTAAHTHPSKALVGIGLSKNDINFINKYKRPIYILYNKEIFKVSSWTDYKSQGTW